MNIILLNIIEFILLFVINNIIPSILFLTIIKKYFDIEIDLFYVFVSLAIGQLINGLFFYYMFLFLPNYNIYYYIISLLFLDIVMIIIFKKALRKTLKYIIILLEKMISIIRKDGIKKTSF
jgi:hypothetical protein